MQLRVSVLISTYQTGHLVVVSAREGRLTLTFHQFERAMGIACKAGTIAVCTREEVWFLRNAPDIAAKLQHPGRPDACYLARTSHFTDDIHADEAAWVGGPDGGGRFGQAGGEFWIVNTLFSCFDLALVDVGLANNDVLRQLLHDYFAWATTTTMSRYHQFADDVPDGLSIPHWSWDGLQE